MAKKAAGDVTIGLSAETAQFSSEFKNAGKAVNEFDNQVKKSGSTLKTLKENFGRGSMLNQSLKIAAGGGAVAGIGLAAREVTAAAQQMVDFNNKAKMGELTATEMKDQFYKMIPVIGAIGVALDEAFTGTRFTEKMTKQFIELKKTLDQQEKAGALATKQFSLSGPELELSKVDPDRDKRVAELDKEQREKQKGMTRYQRGELQFEYDGLRNQAYEEAEKRKTEIIRLAAAEREAIGKAHENRLNDLERDNNLARLKAKEDVLGEALASIDKSYADQRAAVAAELAKTLATEKDADRQREARQRAKELTDKLYGNQRDDKKFATDKFNKDLGTRVSGIDGETAEAKMRADGRNTEADIAANRRETAAKMAAAKDAETYEAIRRQGLAKEAELVRQNHLAIQDLDEKAKQARIASQEAYYAAKEAMDAEYRDKELRHAGKGYEADKEAIDRESLLKQRAALQKGLSSLSIFGIGSGNAAQEMAQAMGLIKGDQASHDQKMRDLNEEHTPLPTATERRFDFTLPGVDNPQFAAVKEQLKKQDYANKKHDQTVQALQDLVKKTLAVVGIK
jgi:hypothetical protein